MTKEPSAPNLARLERDLALTSSEQIAELARLLQLPAAPAKARRS